MCLFLKTSNQARLYTRAWMWVYNNERPHSSLGYLPTG
ncbi:MAG: integrase core domain-containing protein [Bacteroidota bacterium]